MSTKTTAVVKEPILGGGNMKSEGLMWFVTTILFATSTVGLPVAQAQQHHHYIIIDLGTFGGPSGHLNLPENSQVQVLNNRGAIAGWADTPALDPNSPNCFNEECFITHAFRWQKGVLTDLGVLPGGDSSNAEGLNEQGWIVGISQTGEIDPLLNIPASNAVLWKDGQIINLGTLGGYESFAGVVNCRGQILGFSTTNESAVPDPLSFLSAPIHPFLWENGVMRDLGTLGGTDSGAAFLNELGQVAGFSYTSLTPNDTTGVPTVDPFLWENGKLIDLGSLGGTLGFPNGLNNLGQVVGQSNLAGDAIFHPFLWENGKIRDLGTLGGDTGYAVMINEAGEIVGTADVSGNQIHHGVDWTNGAITDIGTLPGDPCSRGLAINSSGLVVGDSSDCNTPLHAVLWENGSLVDLNTFLPSNSSLQQLTMASSINDRGEIVGLAVPPGVLPLNQFSLGHAFLAIPCDENHPNVQGCDLSSVDAAAVQSSAALIPNRTAPVTSPFFNLTPREMAAAWRARMARRYHVPVPGSAAPEN
jgi:probable HAF family extracellular repeat protein